MEIGVRFFFFLNKSHKTELLTPRYRYININYNWIYVYYLFIFLLSTAEFKSADLENRILFIAMCFYNVADECNISNRFDFKLLFLAAGKDKLSARKHKSKRLLWYTDVHQNPLLY